MDSDEDFVVSAPSKKAKKNAGEEKGGKKKKTSESKGERTDTSPKRKTPARKKEKEDGKKPKAKAKPKKKGGDDDDEEEEKETEAPEGFDGDVGDDNYEPDRLQVPVSESEVELSDVSASDTKSKKKKAEKKEPKKGKKGGGGMDSDQTEIFEYLKRTNRPYSVINIFDNLHGKIKKAACQKALDSLVDDGELQAKEFGKAKIYLLNQQNIPQVSAEDMDKLKENLNEIKKEHTKLSEEVKEMNTYLKNLNNQLTNEQLTEEIEKYKKLTEELTKKLEVFESGNYPKISDEEMKVIEDKRKKMETEFKKRKRMCNEMINTMADSMDMKRAALVEMIGIEED